MRPGFFERLTAELPRLYRDARRLTRTAADAEDLAHATVVRALEQSESLRDEERMRAWLLRVQRSVLLNSRRGLALRLEVIQGGRGTEVATEPAGDLERDVLEHKLDDQLTAALATLAPEWREALLLREVDELTYEEIAEVQHCPVGTVRSRLSRARAALLEALTRTPPNERGEASWQPAIAIGSRASRRGTTAK